MSKNFEVLRNKLVESLQAQVDVLQERVKELEESNLAYQIAMATNSIERSEGNKDV